MSDLLKERGEGVLSHESKTFYHRILTITMWQCMTVGGVMLCDLQIPYLMRFL